MNRSLIPSKIVFLCYVFESIMWIWLLTVMTVTSLLAALSISFDIRVFTDAFSKHESAEIPFHPFDFTNQDGIFWVIGTILIMISFVYKTGKKNR